jgi:hypothetical protein
MRPKNAPRTLSIMPVSFPVKEFNVFLRVKNKIAYVREKVPIPTIVFASHIGEINS